MDPDNRPEPEASPAPARGFEGYGFAVILVALATSASAAGRTLLALPDIAMLFLLVIMIAAARFGRGPSVLAAVLSVASYDFFFIPPYFTLAVSEARNTLTFLMMFAVGLLISGLTHRIRRQEQEARAREEATAALYAFSRELGSAIGAEQMLKVVAAHAAKTFGCSSAVLVAAEDGAPRIAARSGDIPFDSGEQAVAFWVLEHARPAGLGTEKLPGARITCLPLSAGSAAVGALALTRRSEGNILAEDRCFNEAFVRQCAMALERTRLSEDARLATLRARTEEMRSSLLSAVSHDLRTPLAAITGAGTMLRDDSARVSPEQRADLLGTICEEAERLERLVSNLLDMTRLESGGLTVKRDWVPLEELVTSALARLETALGKRSVKTELPDDLPLLSVDPVLFEQVFWNLLENAIKYTPDGGTIDIRARVLDGAVMMEVADRGSGFRAGEESKVFEKFFRGARTGGGGVGLGLAICRGIVEAHGGVLSAENRPGGGALFRIVLPILGTPPAMTAEEPHPGASRVSE